MFVPTEQLSAQPNTWPQDECAASLRQVHQPRIGFHFTGAGDADKCLVPPAGPMQIICCFNSLLQLLKKLLKKKNPGFLKE